MELKTFVAETLQQIVDGVLTVQKDAKGKNWMVSPPCIDGAKGGGLLYSGPGGNRTVQMVEFDISLCETEGSEGGARIGVFFGSAGVGAHAKAEAGSTATNRVKFSVPVILPRGDV